MLKGKRKILIISIVSLIIIAMTGIIAYYWYNNTYYVSTEDAKVDADMVFLWKSNLIFIFQ